MPVRLLQEYIATVPQPPKQPQVIAPTADLQLRDTTQAPVHIDKGPFGPLDVWFSVNGATIITWKQNQDFKGDISDKAVLFVEFSRTPAFGDTWQRVSENPLGYYFEDKVNRHRGQTIEGAYRIRLVDGKRTWISTPTNLFQKLTFTEYRTALKILRNENRQVYSRSPGFLFKRRWLGTRCTKCNNFLVNNAEQEQCNICYGTGFIGGFFEPIQCPMAITGGAINHVVDPTRGPIADSQVSGRVNAYFAPEMNDVWVDSTTGSRWRVQGYSIMVHSRSVPLVIQCVLKHIPTSDPIYSLKKDL